MAKSSIRYPSFAGQFYPADKVVLQSQINSLLSESSKFSTLNSQIIKLLIVPHAGYDYSGIVAAAGYKQIPSSVKRVILIGCSHQANFEGAAIDDNDFWLTPLGKIQVDKKFAQNLIDNKFVEFNSDAHTNEHSLEVQLPFLQTVLKDFKIVPILLGSINNLAIYQFSNLIMKSLDNETLIVISSDLSHYPDYDTANKIDNETINSILSGDPVSFEQTVSKQMTYGYENLITCACADKAIVLGMTIAKNLKGGLWQLIKYANSGDISAIKDQVVGYTAVSFSLPS